MTNTIKLLGILDILTGVSLLLLNWNIQFIPLVFFIIFTIKSAIFFPSLASAIDFLAGIFFLIAIFGPFSLLTWIAAIWIFQKGILSLL